MTTLQRFLVLSPLCVLVACGNTPANPQHSGAAGSGTAGTTNAAGTNGGSGTNGGAGTNGGSGSDGTAGTTGAAGDNGTAGTTGAAGDNGTAGTTGTAGNNGTAGTTGTAGTKGAGGTTGAGGSTGTAGTGGGNWTGVKPSPGCGMPPAVTDSSTKFVLKEIHVPGTFDPVYLAGGAIYTGNQLPQAGKYDYQFRPWGLKLPKTYNASTPYAVIIGGGGCGGNAANFASNPGGGYQPDGSGSTIEVGLSYLAGCFDDGGSNIKNRADSPDVPYVKAIIDTLEKNYCVDENKIFLTGTSSGGWESYTVGCALADTIRAIGPVSGGLRLHRPACTGPQASIMVEGLLDTANPIGPIVPPSTSLDSPGSAPARDEILKRNGCVPPDFVFDYSDTTKKQGNAPHVQWDAANYPSCVKYTGCPAAYPVVWCALNCGHQCDNEPNPAGGKFDYKVGIFKFWSSLP